MAYINARVGEEECSPSFSPVPHQLLVHRLLESCTDWSTKSHCRLFQGSVLSSDSCFCLAQVWKLKA